jgi:dUTP pyrophosphatase
VAELKIRITRVGKNLTDISLPRYTTDGSAGMDLHAAVEMELVIQPGETVLVPTGYAIELPHGHEAQIRPRSGLAIKHHIGILNAPGTIDSDYRGEIKVILTNFGKNPFTVKRGDRIAQMVVARYERITWVESDSLTETDRGSGGFGHTGH